MVSAHILSYKWQLKQPHKAYPATVFKQANLPGTGSFLHDGELYQI